MIITKFIYLVFIDGHKIFAIFDRFVYNKALIWLCLLINRQQSSSSTEAAAATAYSSSMIYIRGTGSIRNSIKKNYPIYNGDLRGLLEMGHKNNCVFSTNLAARAIICKYKEKKIWTKWGWNNKEKLLKNSFSCKHKQYCRTVKPKWTICTKALISKQTINNNR